MESRINQRFPDYEIRSDGRVFRIRPDLKGRMPGEIKGRVLRSGYRQFKLNDADGRQILIRANRLVAETFHGPAPSPLHQAAHNDGVKLNNFSSNVRWATAKENMGDLDLHGTRRRGDRMPNAKLTNEQADEIRLLFTGEHGQIASLSRQYGTGRNAIYRVISGETYSAPGQSALDKKQGAFA